MPLYPWYLCMCYKDPLRSQTVKCLQHGDGCDACDLRKVKVTEAGSATRILILPPPIRPASSTVLHNTAASVQSPLLEGQESLHFLVFLNALIDREYPGCQSK